MTKDKNQLYESDTVGVCSKDDARYVWNQNEVSKSLCGDNEGSICTKCPIDTAAFKKGFSHLKNQSFFTFLTDIIVVKETSRLTTLIYPQEDRLATIREEYKGVSFTSKEKQVFDLLIIGKTNTEIMRTLFISKATLKSHLNHMYRKAPTLKDLRSKL